MSPHVPRYALLTVWFALVAGCSPPAPRDPSREEPTTDETSPEVEDAARETAEELEGEPGQ